jgi:hypothetical protein
VGGVLFLWGLATSEVIETHLPLCARHRNHFFFRNLLTKVILGAILLGLLFAAGDKNYVLALALACIFMPALLILIIAGPGVYAKEITGDTITLAGVSAAFTKQLVIHGYSDATFDASETRDEAHGGLPKYPG